MGLKEQLATANEMILQQTVELGEKERESKRLSTELASATERVSQVEEGLNRVKAMMDRDNIGWTLVGNAPDIDDDGFELEDLKKWSKDIRETAVGGSLLGRGFRFRRNYIWRDNVRYNNHTTGGKGAAAKQNSKKWFDDPYNQRYFFSPEARGIREMACFADGIYVAVGTDDGVSKRIRPIPLEEITAIWVDPDNHDEIWAYRHSWSHRNSDGTSKEMNEWIFVDLYKDHETDYVLRGGVREVVNRTKTAFDEHPNRIHGWALGAPDALAAYAWNGVINKAYSDGISMTAAMAKLFGQVVSSNPTALQNAAAALAQVTPAGATSLSGAHVSPLSSAGKGYAFDTLRPIVAQLATSLDVPTIAITSDTANAGSSYGAAQTLDGPTQYAMEERRAFHIPLDLRVMRWLGAPDATAHFKPLLNASDKFRLKQSINADLATGIWKANQIKAQQLALEGYDMEITDWESIPAGYLLPNNKKSLDLATIDADGEAQPSASASGQGQNNGAGVGKTQQDQSVRTDR